MTPETRRSGARLPDPGRVAQRESARPHARSRVQNLPRHGSRRSSLAAGSVTSSEPRSRGERMSATNEMARPDASHGRGGSRGRSQQGLRGRRCRRRALDGVSVNFERARYTAIMGPSGSGSPRCSTAWPASTRRPPARCSSGTSTSRCCRRRLTLLRRRSVGFIFQAYNLVPTLTAAENITLPLDIAGEEPDGSWFDVVVDAVRIRDRLSHRPAELSGWAAAAGRRGAGARHPPRDRLRGRADGQPGLEVGPRDPRVPPQP